MALLTWIDTNDTHSRTDDDRFHVVWFPVEERWEVNDTTAPTGKRWADVTFHSRTGAKNHAQAIADGDDFDSACPDPNCNKCGRNE